MTKQFKDYPAVLQRIVELTPEGWPDKARCVTIAIIPDGDIVHFSCDKWAEFDDEYTRTEYEQCRAAYQQQQWRTQNTARQNDLPVDFVEESLAAINEAKQGNLKPYKTAAQRHANAEDIKAGDVDWRGLLQNVLESCDELDPFLPRKPACDRRGAELYSRHLMAVDEFRSQVEKARAALEASK